MHKLTQLIRSDMVPALGVTEPGAIAFAAARVRDLIGGNLCHLTISMNSGLYKNAYSCGLPGAQEVGAVFAAALGYVAGDASKELETLDGIRPEDIREAHRYADNGMITVELLNISSRIELHALLETDEGTAEVEILDKHTNIVCERVNGEILKTAGSHASAEESEDPSDETEEIQNLTLREILDYVENVPAEEIAFVSEAYRVNMALFHAGLESSETTFVHQLYRMNGSRIISDDEQKTASLLCNGAIEARVLGLSLPAMSITGSGAHGIMATLPLYAVCQVRHLSDEMLHRATVLSYLICTVIKNWSGRLSALCGCGIAGGTGMACGLAYLNGGRIEDLDRTIRNMASSLTGMICDGGNQGCVMKGVAACNAAFASADLAVSGVSVDCIHGINGRSPEETMRNIGLIASPGMTQTEKTIVEIQRTKSDILSTSSR